MRTWGASVESRLAQQMCSVGAGDLLEHGVGELPNLWCQGDIAVRGGVGLAAAGEPVQHGDELLPSGLVWLVSVDERPAVAGDGVAVGPCWLTIEKSVAVMRGFWAAAATGWVDGGKLR